jgi:outer membrane protein
VNKKFVILVLLLAAAAAGFGQQITTVAVVDLLKVMQTFYSESAAMRDYRRMLESVQTDIERQQTAINQLTERKLIAENNGDEATALRLDNEIFQKKQYLQEYWKIKNAQLETTRASLVESSSFLNQVLQAVESVSFNGGYSIVLDISSPNSNVLWYSKVVDITNDVVQRLRQTSR